MPAFEKFTFALIVKPPAPALNVVSPLSAILPVTTPRVVIVRLPEPELNVIFPVSVIAPLLAVICAGSTEV